MSTFVKCQPEVRELANSVLVEFETHKPLLDTRVTIDFVFAHADTDEAGQPVGHAIKHHGHGALGLCRKTSLKDRVMGRADAEIMLDGDWWKAATEEERRALLDHEMHHIAIKIDKRGLVRDDIGRPALQMRKHDYEFGFFKIIAARHGENSLERHFAKVMMAEAGQYFWPDLVGKVE